MLTELHISNLAVIEDARIEFSPGLNAFTGSTGAGKSLVLGALELLLGLRSGVDMLRHGCEEGRVTGVFHVLEGDQAQRIAACIDQPIRADEPLILTRRLLATGRTSVSINGQPATGAMVRAVGEHVVDIHGQHDHQVLLKPAHQLAVLDRAADNEALLTPYRAAVRELGVLRRRRAELHATATLRRQQRELYRFQAQEIDKAHPQPGELLELRARAELLSQVHRLRRETDAAHAALHEADGSINERLAVLNHLLQDLAMIDADLQPVADAVKSHLIGLQEAAFDLRRYSESLDVDPAELGEVEERLNTLNRVISRYVDVRPGEDPSEALLAYREHLRLELDRLSEADADTEAMDRSIEKLNVTLEALGRQLSQRRRAAAERLRPLIEAQLAELGMPEAQLELAMTTQAHLDAGENPGEPGGPGGAGGAGAEGFDTVEFQFRPNPGQPARPLRKIASGGELSRVMLALKSVLADHDRISVLVFDEIDANIGSRMGSVIGGKLKALAGASHQVLCITHLPQIAAFAHRHLKITKQVKGKGKARTTVTMVQPLEGSARIDELAEMLAGQHATDTTRQQASELLSAAAP